MLSGDQVVGVIIIKDDDQEHRYTEEDVALMSTIAGQVATSLENLRLLDQAQRNARRERLIHEITSKVRRSADIPSILETAAREVGRALNASRASVRLGEASKAQEGLSEPSGERAVTGQEPGSAPGEPVP